MNEAGDQRSRRFYPCPPPSVASKASTAFKIARLAQVEVSKWSLSAAFFTRFWSLVSSRITKNSVFAISPTV